MILTLGKTLLNFGTQSFTKSAVLKHPKSIVQTHMTQVVKNMIVMMVLDIKEEFCYSCKNILIMQEISISTSAMKKCTEKLTSAMILTFELAYVRLVSMNCAIEVYLYLVNSLLFSESGRLLSRAQTETTTSMIIFKTITITAKEDFYKCSE